MVEAAGAWKEMFANWPAGLERRGVLVTSYDEQVPFSGFATSDALLLLERTTPDTAGARKVIVAYQNIVAVKLTDVVKMKVFAAAGFVESKQGHAAADRRLS